MRGAADPLLGIGIVLRPRRDKRRAEGCRAAPANGNSQTGAGSRSSSASDASDLSFGRRALLQDQSIN